MKKLLFPLVAFLTLSTQVISNDKTDPVKNNGSLSEILNEDGTINMDAPSGSYQAIGFELVSGEDDEPVFQYKAEGSDAAWTDPFTSDLSGGVVYAVAKIGSAIYIGGSFTNASNGSIIPANALAPGVSD